MRYLEYHDNIVYSERWREEEDSGVYKAITANRILDFHLVDRIVYYGKILTDFVPTVGEVSLAETLAFTKAASGAPVNVVVVSMDWFQMAVLQNLLPNYFKIETLFCIMRKFVFSILSVGPIPNHIAFILDGNRRYVQNWNMKEGEGHKVGFLSLMSILNYCYKLGIKYVTIYAFRIDNFNRRPNEVQYVMDLMQEKIKGLFKEESIVNIYGIRVYLLGNLKLLNEPVRLVAEKAMVVTAKNDNVVLMICMAYTSTDEIVHDVQESYNDKKGDIRHHEIGKELPIKLADLEKHMYMVVAPNPNILVRTSGENRLSNFLLWQTIFCQLYSPNAL
ncbi:hypothetical protein GIB67_003366 [Kingdonia uniflora]|uniref:Alkyl transferase n=1 Tax=Kingdonia uniflora TaxID=39325 RepID=A0A7J7P9L5_9MAGN|nr:hypothetical protein GIB67_003366 [Kingdonia uniflora]